MLKNPIKLCNHNKTKTKLKNLVEFWGAEDICGELGIPIFESYFYSVLT